MLRLLAQLGLSPTAKKVGVGHEQEGGTPESIMAREAPRGASWDFSKVPLFPPDRATPPQVRSWFSAPPLPGVIQPKLAIGRVDDPLEHEADRVADQVMRMPDPEFSVTATPLQISRKCAVCDEAEKAQNLQTKSVTTLQAPATAPGLVHEVLRSPGQPLSSVARAFMEPRFGHDFGAIRVHTDAKAMGSASAVNALAFTVGHHIVFASDQYAPGTDVGKRLLAHELAHAIQQGGLQQSEFNAPLPIGAAHDASEAEADRVAELIANDRAAKQQVSLLPQAVRIVSRPSLSLQRACDQPESFYQTSPRFCRDDTFSPSTHPGKTCYREVIQSNWGCPPGDHCCFAPDGSVEDSRDVTSLASDKGSDGSCGWRWSCVVRHTLTDYVPAVVGQAFSPLTCAAQCVHTAAPELCTASCVQQAQAQ
jgi:hypothetical protein